MESGGQKEHVLQYHGTEISKSQGEIQNLLSSIKVAEMEGRGKTDSTDSNVLKGTCSHLP